MFSTDYETIKPIFRKIKDNVMLDRRLFHSDCAEVNVLRKIYIYRYIRYILHKTGRVMGHIVLKKNQSF